MAVEDGRIAWFSPDPRTIIPLDKFHVPRRLHQLCRQGRFEITVDTDFESVMVACGDRPEGTWISPDILKAYTRLHQLGFAHSLEVRWEGELAGGIYGVALGGAFFGESMFHRRRDASKVALVALVDRLNQRGFRLFDVQYMTAHLRQFGARPVSRKQFQRRLRLALQAPACFV